MGVQVLVVVVGFTIAVSVGIFAGMWEVGTPLMVWLVIGMVPVLWALLYATEQLIGREIWHYTAPYPYRGMEMATVAEASHREPAPEGELTGVKTEDIRLAA